MLYPDLQTHTIFLQATSLALCPCAHCPSLFKLRHAGYTLHPLNRPSQSVPHSSLTCWSLVPVPGIFFSQIFAWLPPYPHVGLYSDTISSERASVIFSSKVTTLTLPMNLHLFTVLFLTMYLHFLNSSCSFTLCAPPRTAECRLQQVRSLASPPCSTASSTWNSCQSCSSPPAGPGYKIKTKRERGKKWNCKIVKRWKEYGCK